jgi:pimeloyl-ACP methyl ester carboxylesterase
MPYANNNGVKIYYEVEGQGLPLMLAHGVTRSTERWRETGFADALKKDYRLILFDARGHGRSDKPHDPAAYGVNMVKDVLAVLDATGVVKPAYMGYSMGAGIGFACVIGHPERFSRFILGGWSPYRPPTPANAPSMPSVPPSAASQSDPEAFIRLRERMLGRPMTPQEKKEALANDPTAITALLANFRDIASFSNQRLARVAAPCLLYAGEADAMFPGSKEAASHIPGAKFFLLPGLDHVQAGGSPLVLPHVKEFLAEAARA